MKRIFAALALFAAPINIALAESEPPSKPGSGSNLHATKAVHEDLIAVQELIVLGCMGKLKITPIASGVYDPSTVAKLQECADNEGTDQAARLLASQRRGEIEKARLTTYALHNAVMFAKANNAAAETLKTESLIEAAREQGRLHYPYVKP